MQIKPKIALINNAEPGITEFIKPLEKIINESGATLFIMEYSACLPFNFDGFDGIILSGSPQGDDIVEHHAPYFEWIKTCPKPVFGICAGHHITGFLYGSEILRSEEPESGDFEIERIKDDPIFAGMPLKFIVKQMHNDSVTLPEDFELLATSNTCKNQLMKHKQKPLYTCQFHPEFYNQVMVRNFIQIIKDML